MEKENNEESKHNLYVDLQWVLHVLVRETICHVRVERELQVVHCHFDVVCWMVSCANVVVQITVVEPQHVSGKGEICCKNGDHNGSIEGDKVLIEANHEFIIIDEQNFEELPCARVSKQIHESPASEKHDTIALIWGHGSGEDPVQIVQAVDDTKCK